MSPLSPSSGLYPWLKPLYQQLTRGFTAGKLHHAMLIHGVSGLGKRQLSQFLAQYFQCRNPQGNDSCGQCQSCLLHGAATHPDCYFIETAADKSTISIEQIRKVQASIINTGLTNPIRVVVINDAHLMTTSAANALLKVLEEPPKHVYFVLTCSQRSLLPATVISRCLALNAASAPAEKLASWVSQQAGLNISANQLALFSYSPLDALAGVTSGQLAYIEQLRLAVIDVVLANSGVTIALYPLIDLVKTSDVSAERSLTLIHLLLIDCVKIASGLSSKTAFEFTAGHRHAISLVSPQRLLAFEQSLNQLKQLCVSQPSTNKVLQLQRLIVEFMVGD